MSFILDELAHVEIKRPCDGKDVFITPSTHVHANDVIRWQRRRDLHHVCQCVGRLKRGNDPFKRTAKLKRLKRFDVRD